MPRTKKQSTEAAVREIRRRTRRKFAPEENREHQRFMLETELSDAVGAVTDENGLGWMADAQWKALYDNLIEFEALSAPVDYTTAFTDEFLREAYDNGKLRWP